MSKKFDLIDGAVEQLRKQVVVHARDQDTKIAGIGRDLQQVVAKVDSVEQTWQSRMEKLMAEQTANLSRIFNKRTADDSSAGSDSKRPEQASM